MEQNSIQIQIEEDFPDTHYFLYKGKKYPFKFDFFKNSSKYFSTNLSRFEQIEVIPLIDDESGECANIDEDSIDTFIQYVQRQKVTLNNDNVCTLNYLANKFEVPQLINVTKNYISVHQNELVLTILISNQNDSNFVTDVYEKIVSENLPKYIDDEHLLMINIPIIYRILKKFSVSSKKEEKNSMKINEFLFKMLDKNRIKASPLFEFADFELLPNEKFNLLLTKYSNDFDFHFINKNCFQKLYETQSKIIENDIKTRQIQKQQENDILLIKNELSRLQSERLIEKKEQKQKDEVIENMKNEIRQLNEEINKMKIEQTRKIKEESQKIIKEVNLVKKQTEEITKSTKKSIKKDELDCTNGVFKYLFEKYSDPISMGLVEVTGNSYDEDWESDISKIICPTFDSYWLPEEKENRYFIINFKTFSVKITKYRLRVGNEYGRFLFKSWTITGTNEKGEEIILDNVNNCSQITKKNPIAIIEIDSKQFVSSIKLSIKGRNEDNGLTVDMGTIELYGYIKYN